MSSVPSSLGGRVAIVTGGNSGIGLEIARTMARAGASVVIASRRQADNDAALDAIRAAGGLAHAIQCDASQEADVVALVEQSIGRFGRLDVCVASAGGIGGGTASLIEMDTETWRRTLALNLDGVFYLYREAAKQMIRSGNGGSLIGISSVSSIRASASVHYAAAKGGVNAMTTNLAAQLGPHRIRVNAILPGMVQTPATDHILSSDKARANVLKRVPIGRVGLPADIASLACFLASDDASFITAQQFVVDGGMTVT
jgi:NAD(P)-dependent dehydrogenase (short-subunit alcohol dehydrogenase family)